MSLHDKRLIRQMRDPVRGVFRKTGHSGAPFKLRMNGVITAPGIPPMPAAHDVDRHYKQKPIWLAHEEFPILVDRSDPSRFVVLWDEAETAEWKEHEQQTAQQEHQAVLQKAIDQLMARRGSPPQKLPAEPVVLPPGEEAVLDQMTQAAGLPPDGTDQPQ